MCGIFGWFSENIDMKIGKEITGLLKHRGPEAINYFYNKNLFFGHTRLKIIDLSNNANQPFSSIDGNYTIIFNGEIYNYLEIKSELNLLGVKFRTDSDTEVLLNSYIKWGMKFLDKINGMFAFAIYDKLSEKLIIARDHLGQKPLYYYYKDADLIFASELRALLKHPDIPNKISIDNLIKYNYIDVFAFDNTPIKNVRKLLPGHYLVYSKRNLKIIKYWDSLPINNNEYNSEDLIENLDDLLFTSVKRHLRADVPTGIFLSGGMDSSLITFYANKVLGNENLKTYNVSVKYGNFNESSVAESLSKKLGITLKTFELNKNGIINSMSSMFSHLDEPLADPGLLTSNFLSEKAKKSITVALAGDGGDELFGGYLTFKAIKYLKYRKIIPESFLMILISIIRKIFNSNKYMSVDFKLRQFSNGLLLKNKQNSLIGWNSTMSAYKLKTIYNRNIFYSLNKDISYEKELLTDFSFYSDKIKDGSMENVFLYQYQKYFLPEFVLAHTDRASMRSALEVRAPLLDKSIVEFANAIPVKIKLKNGILKKVLIDLMNYNNFPKTVIKHKKQGFTFPVALWIKTYLRKDLTRYIEYLIENWGQIYNGETLIKLLDEHMNGKENNYRILWNLAVMSNWLMKYEVNF